MQVQASGRRFDSDAAGLRFFTEALERVRKVPGVVSAGLTVELPLSGDADVYGVEFDGENNPGGEPALRYAVSPGYLETMRIPLRRGRLLNEHDGPGAPVAVLINEAFANRKFPGRDPIGQRVRVGLDVGHGDKPWATIVGVVGNVKQQSLAMGDSDAFYISTAHWAWLDTAQHVVVRARGDAAALAPAVRAAIWSVDKDEPIVQVATMDRLLAASEAQRHFVLMLFEAFALVGLVLAATGIYGVLACSVSETDSRDWSALRTGRVARQHSHPGDSPGNDAHCARHAGWIGCSGRCNSCHRRAAVWRIPIRSRYLWRRHGSADFGVAGCMLHPRTPRCIGQSGRGVAGRMRMTVVRSERLFEPDTGLATH